MSAADTARFSRVLYWCAFRLDTFGAGHCAVSPRFLGKTMTTRLAAALAAPPRKLPDALLRAAVGDAVASATRTTPAAAIAKIFGDDAERIATVHRAATAPLTVGGDPALAAAVSAFVTGLMPLSAAASVFAQALQLDMPNSGGVAVPGLGAAGGGFVAEAAPIPVTDLPASAPALTPFKLAGLSVISETLAKSSNAEALIGDALRRSAASTLDAVLFGSDAASPAQPAGVLFGLAPTGGTGDMLGDLGMLADAVGLLGAPVFVASPGGALKINSKLPGSAFGSAAVAAGTVIGLVPGALAYAIGEPEIASSKVALLHMSDTALPLVDGATADPAMSAFQTAAIAIRLLVDVSWSLRGAAAAFVEGAQW
jgi:hypothetical protein